MPRPTPLHPRTSALCSSMLWKDWAGWYAVCSYDTCHEPEYHAVRQSAGLLDVSPLIKIDVTGAEALEFLAYVTARDVGRLETGQVGYGCWCDEHGKLLDDGTITRWDDRSWRVTSADPILAWLLSHADRFDVQLRDVTEELAALALQGPRSRAILADVLDEGDVQTLRFFRALRGRIAGVDVDVTRTGYTGDLGYELWMPAEHALTVWDALMEAGRPHGVLPLGLDALDVCRVEAGFILMGVDYFSARTCLVPAQTSSPFELGLGWTVHLDRDPFLGQAALRAEQDRAAAWAFVGLELDWDELEALYDAHGLPPSLPAGGWRTAVPVYSGRKQVGQATSGTWSPILKKNIALGSVHAPFAAAGTRLRMEVTVEYARRRVTATVVDPPFFDPERKRSTPARSRAKGAATT